MTRLTLAALLLAAPAAAQITTPDFDADPIEPGLLSCDLDGTEVGCVTETEAVFSFCMAVDAAGEPVANSTSVSDAGVVLFQNVEPARIAALRCQPV